MMIMIFWRQIDKAIDCGRGQYRDTRMRFQIYIAPIVS